MKLTESQLRNVINEEIASMIEEGELDEKMFAGLKNLASRAGRAATRGIEKAKSAGRSVAKTYKAGSLAGDMDEAAEELNELFNRLKKLDTQLAADIKLGMGRAVAAMKATANKLRQMEE